MLSLSLNTGLELFTPLVNGPVNNGLFKVSPDLNQSLLQFSHVAYWLLVYAFLQCAAVAMETAQLHSINPQLNVDAFWKKIIHNGPILMKLCQPVLWVRLFFKHSV